MNKAQFGNQRRGRDARERAKAHAQKKETQALKDERLRQQITRAQPGVEKRRLLEACYRSLAVHIDNETCEVLRSAWIANKARMIRDKVMATDADYDDAKYDGARPLEDRPELPK